MSERRGRGTWPFVRFLVVAVLACALVGAVPPQPVPPAASASASRTTPGSSTGLGISNERLDRLELLGVDLVRFNLHWDQIEATRGQPAWEDSDAVLEGLHSRGIAAVVGLVGSPRWANGGRTPNFAPGAASFAAFARAAATRYRWVREWLIWNEPNQVRWLRPTTAAVYVRQILNPAYGAIHAVIPRAKVGGGVTAPRASAGGVSPVAWIRGMRAAGARLDAYAHHPYPSSTRETPFAGRLRPLHDDHDGHARAAPLRGQAARSGRSGSG